MRLKWWGYWWRFGLHRRNWPGEPGCRCRVCWSWIYFWRPVPDWCEIGFRHVKLSIYTGPA